MDKLFKDTKVVVMGLGLHGGGVGTARFFCEQGAKVLVTDLKTEEQLKESIKKLKDFDIEYHLGGHKKEDFIKTDFVIKNPDVPNDSPYLAVAVKHNVPVKTDIGIFFDLMEDNQIIGVTGSKGKSTVATLIYQFLKSKEPDTILAGNIGTSVLEALSKIKKKSKIVLELSSFELEDLNKSPRTAVITNILPDHLNRYKTINEYIEAKKMIFRNQKKNDILVLNYDDPRAREFVSFSKTYFYSIKEKPKNPAAFLKGKEVFFDDKFKPTCSLSDFKLFGEHNISNLLAAVSAAKLLKIPCANIRKVLKNFKGVPFRQEFIAEKKGVKYFNDTTATMPDAVCQAIRTFRQRFPRSKIILIAGGQDKVLDYKVLAKEIKNKIDYLVLLPGTATDKLKKELKSFIFFPVESMEKAINKASKLAKKGDIVLLSPGGASFNLFKNEFDRGEQFNKWVRRI